MRKRYTTVSIGAEVKGRLEVLRRRLGVGSYEELILRLVEEYEECSRLRAEARARELMCNDLAEARASMAGWVRLLLAKLGDPELLPYAVEYLVRDPQDPGVYVVNKERCAQQP